VRLKVTNHWFDAVFPTPVEVTEEATDVGYATTTDFSCEVEPFGLYSVRVTQMPRDPFIAVGPRQWVKTYGDHWPAKFAEFKPQVLRDEGRASLEGATRELDVRLDYQGPCNAFVRLFAHPDGETGRIVVAAVVVGSSPAEEAAAQSFLNSLKPRWAPAR